MRWVRVRVGVRVRLRLFITYLPGRRTWPESGREPWSSDRGDTADCRWPRGNDNRGSRGRRGQVWKRWEKVRGGVTRCVIFDMV